MTQQTKHRAGVAPGWQRTNIDGRAEYRQSATVTTLAPVKPVTGPDLIRAWGELAAAHTAAIPRAQTIDAGDGYGRGNGLSSASELAERRKTSAMYLWAYCLLTAGTIGGLVALAAITGVIGDGAQAFAFWLAGTGIVSLSLAAWQHRRELGLTPEGLESERQAYDYDIAAQDAESRRILAQAHADAIRQQAAAQLEDAQARRLAAQQATQQALLQAERQIAQHETPQSERRALVNYQPAQAAFRRAELSAPAWKTESAQRGAESPTAGIVDSARRKLLDFILQVYAEDGFDGDGYLRKGVTFPLSARSGLTPTERTQAQDLLTQLPTPFAEYDTGRKMWRIDVQRYPTAQSAITAIDGTVTRL